MSERHVYHCVNTIMSHMHFHYFSRSHIAEGSGPDLASSRHFWPTSGMASCKWTECRPDLAMVARFMYGMPDVGRLRFEYVTHNWHETPPCRGGLAVWSDLDQIDPQLSRFVIDSQTPVLKCVFYNLAFIKWLCGGSSEDGADCLTMSIKRECRRTLRARPPTKNNANQVRTAPACSTRYGRTGRKARLVQLRKENAATTKTGKLSTPGWNQCKASLVKLEKIQENHTLIKAL